MNIIDKFHNWRRKLRWNRQYRNGRWEKLKGDKEVIRYQQIIDDIEQFGSANPSILDLGCGEGILCDRMKNESYSYFLGMDFSSVSIKNANALNLGNADFICANVHNFQPEQTFDVIIFNEVFYYIHDTERQNVLNRMLASLNENGIIIVSIFREGGGCWNYFENLKQLSFKQVMIDKTDSDKTYWKIGTYSK
ncbi:MAG: class I SAM-dependent methyltransferase [Aquaticitalea sp.]